MVKSMDCLALSSIPTSTLQRTSLGLIAALFCACLLFASCTEGSGHPPDAPPEVNMTMMDYAFAAPDSVLSGWVTFQMKNRGEETHEFVLVRLPGSKSFGELYEAYIAPMDSLQQLHLEGTIDSSEHEKAIKQILPKWIGKVEGAGGGGLLGPGQSGEVTLNLEPGEYAMVCFIASPNKRRHAYQGMAKPLIVTEDSSDASPPSADVQITSTGAEMAIEGAFEAGPQTASFSVSDTTGEDVEPHSSVYIAPMNTEKQRELMKEREENIHSIRYLNGVLGVPEGKTGYMTNDLSSGRYALVLARGGEKDIVKEIEVE